MRAKVDNVFLIVKKTFIISCENYIRCMPVILPELQGWV